MYDKELTRLRMILPATDAEDQPQNHELISKGLQVIGDLMAYGIDYHDLQKRVADYGQHFAQHGASAPGGIETRDDGKDYCTHCGSRIKGDSPHSLGTGLIYNLVLMAKATHLKGERALKINEDLPALLGHKNIRYENLSNTSNLRFFGLVAKVKREDGTQLKNTWLITKRGWEFLRGEVSIPSKVWSKDNRITKRSDKLVSIHDFQGLPMKYPQRDETGPEEPES